MSTHLINVLYVDDEPVYLTAFRASFRRKYNVFTAASALEAIDILNQQSIHVIISDNRMPGIKGVEFFAHILNSHDYQHKVRILLTAYKDIDEAIDAINSANVYKFILKPWDEEEMEKIIQEAYDKYLEEKSQQTSVEMAEFFVRQRLLS